MDDFEKQEGTSSMPLQALCIIQSLKLTGSPKSKASEIMFQKSETIFELVWLDYPGARLIDLFAWTSGCYQPQVRLD